MAENRIQYTARNFEDYKNQITNLTKQYYPDMMQSYSDASIGQWLIELYASIADELSYHIDRTFQETDINAAQSLTSLLSMARNNGVRVPGPKSAMVEVELSCTIPMSGDNPALRLADENYCPIVKRGTTFVAGTSVFELQEDVNFGEQFDYNGVSNRQIIPQYNSNGQIVSYTYKKLGVAVAGQSRIYRKIITASDIQPFMEVTLTGSDLLGVESVIVKEGVDYNSDPPISQFYVDAEEYYENPTGDNKGKIVRRFFEVDSLVEQYRFGHEQEEVSVGNSADKEVGYNPTYAPVYGMGLKVDADDTGSATSTDNADEPLAYTPATIRQVMKGKWKRFKNKFTAEWTPNWNITLTFGSGIRNVYGSIPEDAQEFTQYMMSRMHANDYMGVLPEPDTTMYVLYRIGGGEQSNIAKGALTKIQHLSAEMPCNATDTSVAAKVYRSLRVVNTTPSYGGKDRPNIEELRHLIKYASASQNRCVTVNDYYARIAQLPPQFGCPFRHSVVEENNKIVVYCLGLDANGNLTSILSEQVALNLKNYLSRYRMINDLIEFKSGKIINVSFEISVFVDKSYDKSEVVKRIIDTVYDYMDIRKLQMGTDIFLGDLDKELSKLDGVLNLTSIQVYNEVGDGYSSDQIAQPIKTSATCDALAEGEVDKPETETQRLEVDLDYSDYILFGDAFSMFEIKNKNKDILVRVKTR